MRLVDSFGYAFSGLRHAWACEANLRVHLIAAAGVIVCAGGLGLSYLEVSVLVLCCALVVAAELFNTAVERLADRVTTAQDPLIGQCKDVAAAAVLTCACGSSAVGLMLLGPPLWRLVRG